MGGLARAIASNRKATAGFVILVVFCFLAAFPGLIAHDNPQAEIYDPTLGPSGAHLLGTTAYGQDLFAQLIYSTRESLFIAVAAGALATVLSVIVGVTAAYIGGLADNVLSLVTDIFLVIPAFPLIVVIAAYSKNGGDPILIAVLVVTGWSYGARQLRVQALSIRNRDFLVAARLAGRAALAGDRVGNAAHHDVFDSGHLPRHHPVRHRRRRRPAVRRAGQPRHPELGDHALLGAKQRGPASWVPAVGDHARGVHRHAGRRLRPVELRLRRGEQPGPAPGAKEAPVTEQGHPGGGRPLRGLRQFGRHGQGGGQGELRAVRAASSWPWWASPAAASRHCCSPSPAS